MDTNLDELERLSAAMDEGHPDDGDFLAKVSDADLKAPWARYHLIGDSLRGQLPANINQGLAARLRSRMADEPTVLAPRRVTKRWVKPVAGLAIAASVAAIAVISAQRMQAVPEIAPTPSVALQTPQFFPQPAPIAVVRWDDSNPAAASRLNSYMVNYSEYRASVGVPGILPYVRVVGYQTDQ